MGKRHASQYANFGSLLGFASTNLNFKSVFVRFVRVVRIPSPRFINFHLSSGGMIADNHFK